MAEKGNFLKENSAPNSTNSSVEFTSQCGEIVSANRLNRGWNFTRNIFYSVGGAYVRKCKRAFFVGGGRGLYARS